MICYLEYTNNYYQQQGTSHIKTSKLHAIYYLIYHQVDVSDLLRDPLWIDSCFRPPTVSDH